MEYKMKQSKKDFDFFISHAYEDKEVFVRPLAERLKNIGYKVWYDEFTIKLGDSLIHEISNGIKNSLFGILVLSSNFFKKTWAKKELDALLSKETITNCNCILPIWFNINKKDVYEFSPLLVDKWAISASENDLDKVVSEIERKTKINITTLEMVNKKINFLKTCNTFERDKYCIDLEHRIKSLFYYNKELMNQSDDNQSFIDKEDDITFELKERELSQKYNIPYGVWYSSEAHPLQQRNRIIKLCKKWINRTLTCKDAAELDFLTNDYMDADLHYILYGFPYNTIKNSEALKKTEEGIYEIGVKKYLSSVEKEKAFLKVFDEYYFGE